jgi:hypothetical protein
MLLPRISHYCSVGLCIQASRNGMVFCRSVRHWHNRRLGVSLEVTHCIEAIARHIAHYTLSSMSLQSRTHSPCHIETDHLYCKALHTASLTTSMPFSRKTKRPTQRSRQAAQTLPLSNFSRHLVQPFTQPAASSRTPDCIP